MKKVFRIVALVISAIPFLWFILSVADVNMHNQSSCKYQKWNLFSLSLERNNKELDVRMAYSPTPIPTVATEKPKETKAPVKKHKKQVRQKEYVYTYPKENLDLLARLLMAECGSDYISDETIFYVGSVVLNRVEDDRFPNTIRSVIYAHGQYACVINGSIDRVIPTDRCYEIAQTLLETGSVLPRKVVWQAEFRQGNGCYCKSDNQYFCY